MPRKDPITGCMVMTMPEFLNDMAEKEGKGRTGGDILADIVTEMEDDSKRIEDDLRTPERALEAIREAIKEAAEYWYDEEDVKPLPTFEEVVHVVEAAVGQSFKSSGQTLKVEAKTGDGTLYYAEHYYSHWAGTRMEPPEEDSEFYFGAFRPMSKHPWRCFKCDRIREKGARHWTHIKQHDNSKMAVHECPKCNGYEHTQYVKRLERRKAALLRKARK